MTNRKASFSEINSINNAQYHSHNKYLGRATPFKPGTHHLRTHQRHSYSPENITDESIHKASKDAHKPTFDSIQIQKKVIIDETLYDNGSEESDIFANISEDSSNSPNIATQANVAEENYPHPSSPTAEKKCFSSTNNYGETCYVSNSTMHNMDRSASTTAFPESMKFISPETQHNFNIQMNLNMRGNSPKGAVPYQSAYHPNYQSATPLPYSQGMYAPYQSYIPPFYIPQYSVPGYYMPSPMVPSIPTTDRNIMAFGQSPDRYMNDDRRRLLSEEMNIDRFIEESRKLLQKSPPISPSKHMMPNSCKKPPKNNINKEKMPIKLFNNKSSSKKLKNMKKKTQELSIKIDLSNRNSQKGTMFEIKRCSTPTEKRVTSKGKYDNQGLNIKNKGSFDFVEACKPISPCSKDITDPLEKYNSVTSPKNECIIVPLRDEFGNGCSIADAFQRRNRSLVNKIEKRPKIEIVHKDKSKDELAKIRKYLNKGRNAKQLESERISPKIDDSPLHHSSPSSALLYRLASGDKAKIPKRDMLMLTKKNYELLPEIQKRKMDAEKRKELQIRIKAANEYELLRRQKMKAKLKQN